MRTRKLFDAVIGTAETCGVRELWSLRDMIGGGPDPEHVVTGTRDRCAVALLGNHDYGATGSADPTRFGEPGSSAVRSIELARERLSGAEVQWMRARKPAARRGEVQCWHGSPRNPVHEYVGAWNAAACLAAQHAKLGLVGHTHVAAAWRHTPRGASAVGMRVGLPLNLADGKWLLNPGAVGAPKPSRRGRRNALDLQAPDGRAGCCSISSGARRPGTARSMSRLPRACVRARSASTVTARLPVDRNRSIGHRIRSERRRRPSRPTRRF